MLFDFPGLRVRNMGSIVNTPSLFTTYSGPGCTSTNSTYQGSNTGVFKSIVDHSTPGFKKKSTQGAIINSPLEMRTTTLTSSVGSHSVQVNGFNCSSSTGVWKFTASNFINMCAGPLPEWTSFSIGEDPYISRAATAALANVKAPDVLGLANIKELRQTYDSIRHPFSSLRKVLAKHKVLVKELNVIDSIARKQRAGIKLSPSESSKLAKSAHTKSVISKGQVRDASSEYLALVFGILPTMRDIQVGLQTMSKTVSERETARGKFNHSVSSDVSSVYWQQFPSGPNWVEKMRTVTQETIVVRAGALYDARLESLQSRLGLTAHALPAFAWEVLPWSFVVDWFTNAGDFIVAQQNLLTQNFLSEWISVRRELTVTRYPTDTILTNGWTNSVAQSGADVGNYVLFQRVPISLGSRISLSMDLTIDRVNVGAAIALSLQQLTRRT